MNPRFSELSHMHFKLQYFLATHPHLLTYLDVFYETVGENSWEAFFFSHCEVIFSPTDKWPNNDFHVEFGRKYLPIMSELLSSGY